MVTRIETPDLNRLLLLGSLLGLPCIFAGCAGYDIKNKRIDIAPVEGAPGMRSAFDQVEQAKIARTNAARRLIHVRCKISGPDQNPAAQCGSIAFCAVDERNEETERVLPDENGSLRIPVSEGRNYRIKAVLPGGWTMSQEPAGTLAAGAVAYITLVPNP